MTRKITNNWKDLFIDSSEYSDHDALIKHTRTNKPSYFSDLIRDNIFSNLFDKTTIDEKNRNKYTI